MNYLATILLALTLASCTSSDEEANRQRYLIQGYLDLGKFDEAQRILNSVKFRDPHYQESRVWLEIIEEIRSNPQTYEVDNNARIVSALTQKKFSEAGIPIP